MDKRDMGKDILTQVIEVEKEIQTRLAAEKKQAEEWLVKVRAEVEKDMAAEEVRLKESCNRSMEGAVADAERKASEIILEASTLSERLAGLSDGSLQRILMRHIAKVLPA